jgi:imidazole glycerol-phosphate synthase subunit HisF
MKEALAEGGASAVSAGSMFVFHGKHRAVLISYLERDAL